MAAKKRIFRTPEGPGPPNNHKPGRPSEVSNQSQPMDCQGLMDSFSTEEIADLTKELEPMKSPGPDGIPNEFLKGGGKTLHRALAVMYSRCLTSQCTPTSWGVANTTMLYKKGDASLLDNYRGIAMSDTIGKLFCTAINKRLMPTLEFNGVFGKLQFGFRKDHRSTDALFILSHVLSSRKQAGLETFAAFLDLRKAYDVIDRSLLWSSLLNLGLPPSFVTVLKSLYKNTITRVQYGNITSDTIHVESGVRQGCPLSPTLFNLFIAGLVRELEGSGRGVTLGEVIIPALFFADDMVLLAQSESELETLLQLVGNFATDNGLAFNGPKSSILVSTTRERRRKVWTLHNAPIFESDQAEVNESDDYKYLGLLTSSHKDPFHLQQAVMVKKLASDAKILPTLFPQAPGRPALQDLLWRQVSLAGCLYGAEVIEPRKKTLEALDKIQRIVGRKVLCTRPKSTDEGVYGDLGWLPMEYRFHECCLNYRNRLEQLPDDRLAKQVFQYCNALPGKSKWLMYSDRLLKDYHFEGHDFSKVTRTKFKSEVTKRIRTSFTKKWRDDQQAKVTMRFMRVKHQPQKFPSFLDGSAAGFWLHRARTDQIPINSRVFPRQVTTCPHCPSVKETLEHFLLECPVSQELRSCFFARYKEEYEVDLDTANVDQSTQLQYILGFEQTRNQTLKLQACFVWHLSRMRGLTLYQGNDDYQSLQEIEEIIKLWTSNPNQ